MCMFSVHSSNAMQVFHHYISDKVRTIKFAFLQAFVVELRFLEFDQLVI